MVEILYDAIFMMNALLYYAINLVVVGCYVEVIGVFA